MHNWVNHSYVACLEKLFTEDHFSSNLNKNHFVHIIWHKTSYSPLPVVFISIYRNQVQRNTGSLIRNTMWICYDVWIYILLFQTTLIILFRVFFAHLCKPLLSLYLFLAQIVLFTSKSFFFFYFEIIVSWLSWNKAYTYPSI